MTKQEMYTTSIFALYFQANVDVYLDLKYHFYWQWDWGIDYKWAGILHYKEWKLYHSAMTYPVILIILAFNLWIFNINLVKSNHFNTHLVVEKC